MPTKELTADETILVDALAKMDAIFCPYRDWENCGPHASGSLWQRRHNFPPSGVEVFSNEAAARDRMSFSRRVAKLVEAGKLLQCKPRGRTVGVRLTDAADDHTRALAALPCLDESLETVEQMRAISPGGWIRETTIIGREYGNSDELKKALLELQFQLAPVLWRQWVEGRADMLRRVCYRVTPAGVEALTRGVATASGLPDFKDAAVTRYAEIRRAEIEARKHWNDESAGCEIGELPLPASMATAGQLQTTTPLTRQGRKGYSTDDNH